MKIILSPAKKMSVDVDTLEPIGLPIYLEDTQRLLDCLKEKSYDELKSLWKCNDKIAEENFKRIECLDLNKNLTPAVLSYEGIAFQYMAPAVFEYEQFDYIQEHLRILSGFYGVLKAMDGIVPYRLEMQAKLQIDKYRNLYDFWGKKIYNAVCDDSGIIINLASKEYSKCVEKYLTDDDTYITCVFADEVNGKLVQKGTYAKMARGEMVRFMAENKIENPTDLKDFDRLNYKYEKDISSDNEYIFIRQR